MTTPPPEEQTEPEAVEQPDQPQAPAPVVAPSGPTFGAADLESRARRWGTSPAAIRAAFRAAGKERVTLAEGEQLVRDFLSRPAIKPREEQA